MTRRTRRRLLPAVLAVTMLATVAACGSAQPSASASSKVIMLSFLFDGANSWRTLWHVVLPLLRPALAAVGTLVFINTWNEYLWPLIATPGGSPGTIQTGLALFLNTEGANPGPLLAAATVSALPVLVGYLFTARRVTGAFMYSGTG